ncbi:MAG: non-heme iron oxygenase ferredoxin subunit [Proteobacteria bacterium]|nr:non-heme iron oxygenase ferredoxin subunit [Pseudomonadota bacterium]
MHDPDFLRLAPLAELPPNSMRAFTVGHRTVLVCHTRDGVHALDNLCTHGEARLDEGRLRGTRVICPLHGASFDCRNGAVLGAPATVPVASHAVRIVDGWIEVALPA